MPATGAPAAASALLVFLTGLTIVFVAGLRFAKLGNGAQTVAPLSQSCNENKAWSLCPVRKTNSADAHIVEPAKSVVDVTSIEGRQGANSSLANIRARLWRR